MLFVSFSIVQSYSVLFQKIEEFLEKKITKIFRILKKRKNETDNQQFTSHARSGEMLKLKIIEVVRRASTNQNPGLDSDSIGDEDGSEMTEVDLGDLRQMLWGDENGEVGGGIKISSVGVGNAQ